MRGSVAGLIVVCLALAGCSDGGEVEDAQPEGFSDVEVQVSETTGAVRGLVVDASIQPVEGATVSLLLPGDERTTTSDGQGRFAFSDVPAGTVFMKAEKPGYAAAQTSTDVVAGVKEPPIVKVQIARLFGADPFTQSLKFEGFFECSQAGLLIGIYSSSNCVVDYTRRVTGPPGLLPQLDNVTDQEREWHADVGEGWQTQVFEMTWEPSAEGTSQHMGLVVSTYKPERDGAHSFANVGGPSPLRVQLDTGVPHGSAASVEPVMIPSGGMKDMSFFVSVRQDSWPVPAVALNQDFTLFLTQFYYAPAPAEWSIVAGDELPF